MPEELDAVPLDPPAIVVTYTHTADQLGLVGLALVCAIALLAWIALRDAAAILVARRRR